MTSFQTGRRAEAAAAAYLVRHGYKILEQNWRTRYCEIDVVALKDRAIYFVEVKYRRSNRWGSGLDYVTPAKLQQMSFAARLWVQAHGWMESYFLSVVSITGENFAVADFIVLDA